ncbi:MAG: pyrimidine/purine nucleoside phosphorylase [Bacteroidales bacterium]|nr:pyrimidine/purine nucleoside phosphorylase [Bacteroidales bacterium]
MFNTNEYFDGKVKSIAFETSEGAATIGVMAAGEYEFGTSTIEFMTVTSGVMTVQQPGETEWKDYKEFETFRVEKDVKFKVKVNGDTSYRCLYK